MEAKKLKNYINGQWVESKTAKWLEVKNPATDEVIALVPESTAEEIDQTVKAAQDAFWNWRATPPPRRAKLLFDFHEKLQKHVPEIAELIVNERTLPIVSSAVTFQSCLDASPWNGMPAAASSRDWGPKPSRHRKWPMAASGLSLAGSLARTILARVPPFNEAVKSILSLARLMDDGAGR